MSADANYKRGLQLFEMGRYKDAIPYIKNAIASGIDNFEAKYLLAQAYLQINDINKAKVLVTELRSIAPNYSGIHSLLSHINYIEEDIDLSMKSIDMAISLDP